MNRITGEMMKTMKKREIVGALLLVIVLLAMAAPAGAAVTISPTGGDDTALIADAISDAASDDHIVILSEGTYLAHDIVVPAAVTIRADTANGHGPSDTIIDAELAGRIFDDSGNHALAIDNLTLQNGAAKIGSYGIGRGGAIFTDSGDVTVMSSTISGCRAGDGGDVGHGGAIFTHSGDVTVMSSTISGCRAGDGGDKGGSGGAIYIAYSGSVTVMSSTISGCRAGDGGDIGGHGGAIYSRSGSVTVTSSTMSGCRAGSGGGYSGWGGAIFTQGGDVTVTSSTISNCQAGNPDGGGGAIYTSSSGTVRFCRLIGNYAPGDGDTFYGPITAPDNWWGSNAGPFPGDLYNGATADTWLVLGITASPSEISMADISSVSANLTYHSDGATISPATGTDSIPDGIPVTFTAAGGSVLPGSATTSGGVATGTFTPSALGTATITATVDSESVSVPVTVSHFFDVDFHANITTGPSPLAVAFTDESDVVSGTLWNWSFGDGTWDNGTVSSGPVHTYASGGIYTVALTVTNASGRERMTRTGYIIVGPPPTTTFPAPVNPTPGPDLLTDIDTGNSGTGSGSGSKSSIPLMTVTVNIGGDSKADRAVVTGTKLSELIVTGTEQHGPFGSCNPPAGSTFQYLSLEPARYGTITNAVINFTVPQSWLDANTIAPGSVVLYRMTPDCWKPLPTTFLFTKDGTAYFSAVSPGFSQFAIAGTPGAAAPQVTAAASQPVVADTQPPAMAAVAKAPPVSQTTAPPAPARAPAPSSPFPLVPVLIGVCCLGLIGGGWYARRWWIRRQNPALFKEYD